MKYECKAVCVGTSFVFVPHHGVCGKTSGLAWDAILYDQPNTSSVKLQKLYAGDVVVILEPERPDFWVKVQTRNGNTGYVDSGALDFPSGMEGSSSEGLVHMQLYTPRDGIYRVVAEDAVFSMGNQDMAGGSPGCFHKIPYSRMWCIVQKSGVHLNCQTEARPMSKKIPPQDASL